MSNPRRKRRHRRKLRQTGPIGAAGQNANNSARVSLIGAASPCWSIGAAGNWTFGPINATTNHVISQPACIWSYFHNLDGPAAFIVHSTDEETVVPQYWIKGKQLTEEEFNNHPDVIKRRIIKSIEEQNNEA